MATMSTTPNATPYSKGGSHRTLRSGTSTPAARSSQQFVTPSSTRTSTKASDRSVEWSITEPPTTRRSKRGGGTSTLTKITVDHHIFRSRRTTCLHFPFDLSITEHDKVICSRCKDVVSYAHNNIITEELKNKPRRDYQMCLRPWDDENAKHREHQKRQAFFDFHALIAGDAIEVQQDDNNLDDTNIRLPPQKRRRQNKAANNNQQHDDHPIIIDQDGNLTDEGLNLFATKLGTTPNNNEKKLADMLMKRCLPSVFGTDGHLTDNAVEMFERNLQALRKDGSTPNNNETRIAGMLMRRIFENQNTKQYNAPVAMLPSFSHVKPMVVARVPQLNTSVEESARLRTLRLKSFASWVEHLKMGNFNPDIMIDAAIRKRRTIPRHFMIKELNKSRLSAESTLSLFEFAGINITQGAKLALAIDVETRAPGLPRGLRLFAPTSELYRTKGNHVNLEHPSLDFKEVALREVVMSNKKKGQIVTRMKPTWVGSCRPEEAICSRLTALRRSGQFSPGRKRYKTPFNVEEGCTTAGVKWSCDTGNGSFKCCLSALNVKNPQAQGHVVPILEFEGKDDYNNTKDVFAAHPKVKKCIEDTCHRRVMLLEVKVGDEYGYCMTTNVSESHDFKNPSALPALSLERANSTLQYPQPQHQPVDNYAIDLDFSKVTSTKLLYNQGTKLYEGLQFEDAEAKCVGKSLFKTPIQANTINPDVQLKQIVIFGVFTADLKFLYELFGHQGHSAIWSCLFCLLQKKDACRMFEDDNFCVENRTIEMLFQDAKTYADLYMKGTAKEREKSNFRSNITQQHSHSMIHEPILNIPLECVTKASMHIVLGFTNWLVNLSISGYEYIAKKEAAGSGAVSTDKVQFRETMETVLKKLYRYKEFLQEQEKDTQSVVTRQSTVAADILSRTDELESIKETIEEEFSLTEEEAEECRQKQQQLEEEIQRLRQRLEDEAETLVNNSTAENDSLANYTVLLAEQICITNNTILECVEYLKSNGGHTKSKFEDVLKKNGCDRKTYFEGQMVGNHCMNYAEHGEVIYSDMFNDFDPLIEQPHLKEELKSFTSRMTEIVTLWFKIQRVIKSAELQSENTIDEFQANVKKLKDLIVKLLVTDIPIDGWEARLPSFPKSHLLFLGHLLDQLRTWGTLGGFDEQNIESAHAIWNQLMRQMGSTRGKERRKRVFVQYFLKSAEFVQSNILRLKEESKRPNKYAARQTRAETTFENDDSAYVEELADTAEVVGIDDGSFVTDINGEVALHQPLTVVADQASPAANNGDGAVANDANETTQIIVSEEDTMVRKCPHCNKCLLDVAFRVHMYHAHDVVLTAPVVEST